MTEEHEKPERLELPISRSHLWPYLFLGALLGAAFEMLINAPLDALFRNLFGYIFAGNPIGLTHALAHLAGSGEWPAVSLTGIILGASLGVVFYRLKENQKRLQSLQQEFESQVAALRHHYKNLALGLSGFSGRARRKLTKLQERIRECNSAGSDINVEIEALEWSIAILEDASRRLSSTLSEELTFLKALQSDGLTRKPQDFGQVLRHAIQELLELRFQDKAISVEINGQPLNEPSAPLVFPFEPYTLEIILQNIISNAMRYGDFIQVTTAEDNSKATIEIQDNGPGVNIQEIRRILVSTAERREAGSTQLGLRVSLRLLEKCGGRLYVTNKPSGGAAFILEFPKQPRPGLLK